MANHLKKLVFDKKKTDIGEDGGVKWRFSFVKGMAISLVLLLFFILIYGFLLAPNSQKFFSDVVFWGAIACVAIFVFLLVTRTVKKSREYFGQFMLIFCVMIGVYAAVGWIWSRFFFDFYVGYSTFIIFGILAGYGATRPYILNGDLDRNDIFYVFLIIVVLLGANVPIISGAGFLERVDPILLMLKDIAMDVFQLASSGDTQIG